MLLPLAPGLVQYLARIADRLFRKCRALDLLPELLHTTTPHPPVIILANGECSTTNKRIDSVYRL